MDKLEMVMQMVVAEVRRVGITSIDDDKIVDAWNMADAMQAEADKRAVKLPDIFFDTKQNEEWQPDWSQAPDNCHFFCVASNGGYGFFNNIKPELMGDYFYVGCGALMIKDHGYQGNWQDSLRKRPQ